MIIHTTMILIFLVNQEVVTSIRKLMLNATATMHMNPVDSLLHIIVMDSLVLQLIVTGRTMTLILRHLYAVNFDIFSSLILLYLPQNVNKAA